jgi:hypothetical protein
VSESGCHIGSGIICLSILDFDAKGENFCGLLRGPAFETGAYSHFKRLLFDLVKLDFGNSVSSDRSSRIFERHVCCPSTSGNIPPKSALSLCHPLFSSVVADQEELASTGARPRAGSLVRCTGRARRRGGYNVSASSVFSASSFGI